MKVDREESLFLTVSENHRKREYPEYVRRMSQPYREAGGMIAAYEGVILGGGDKLYRLEELNLWLRRYRYAAFTMDVLLPAVHLCLEYAVRRRMAAERPGIAVMVEQAARELLDADPLRLRASSRGWVTIYWLTKQFPWAATPESRAILGRFSGFEDVLVRFTRRMEGSPACMDARALVEQAVCLYQEVFVRYFAPDHSQDDVTWNGASEDDNFWNRECCLPEQNEAPEPDPAERELTYGRADLLTMDDVVLSEEALAAVPEYVAKNFGPSFQTEKAIEEIERTVCVGIHEDRKLLFTDGLPESAYEGTSDQAISLSACREGNRRMLDEHRDSVRQSIRSIEQAFQNALNLKHEPEVYRADRGTLRNSVLWKVGRCEEPQLFQKVLRQDHSTIVVELLIDASGSQRVRQSMVALQSYLFSAALSRLHIPHRVMSYCTYGDYTVLRRFRDYEDGPTADQKILEYRATANNRDGLALAAAGADLLKRREDHKIVLVFSDGLPNDMVSGQNGRAVLKSM